MAQKKLSPIHHSIRERLGYDPDDSTEEVYADWKERTSRVCKPCWELKYCPYGPLVEQLPLLPPLRSQSVDHIEYIKKVLETDTIGERSEIEDWRREMLQERLADPELLLWDAWHEVRGELMTEEAAKKNQSVEEFLGEPHGRPLPPVEKYRVPFDVGSTSEFDLEAFDPDVQARIKSAVKKVRKKYKETLATGLEDNRRPLDKVRRGWFEKEVRNFDPSELPEEIPKVFDEAACNIFGHICPVFFAAEALTETSEMRRQGRYIPFKTKIRVVRRDNYTCQHCGVHLHDDEVEFDHIIPLSKGGSSEESNLRLTCFDCNRQKSDHVEI